MSSMRAPRRPFFTNSARAAEISEARAFGSAGRAMVGRLLTRQSEIGQEFLNRRSVTHGSALSDGQARHTPGVTPRNKKGRPPKRSRPETSQLPREDCG